MSKKFGKLSGSITREYERKGFSKAKASYIGHATAGKIARLKGTRILKHAPKGYEAYDPYRNANQASGETQRIYSVRLKP